MQRKIVVNSKGIEFDVPESYDHQAYGLKLKEVPVEIAAVQVIVDEVASTEVTSSEVSSSEASAGTPSPVKESQPKASESKKVTPKIPKNETKA